MRVAASADVRRRLAGHMWPPCRTYVAVSPDARLPHRAHPVSSCAQSQDPRLPMRCPWRGSCDSASLRAGWRIWRSAWRTAASPDVPRPLPTYRGLSWGTATLLTYRSLSWRTAASP